MNKGTLLFCLFLFSACQKAASPQQQLEVATKGLHSAAISERGDSLAIGSIWHGGSYWRLSDNERLFNWNHKAGESSTFVAIDFSDDGRWVLSAEAHSMVLWDASSGRAERYWTAPAEILDIELNQSANLALLALNDHSAVIFDVRNGGIRRSFNHGNRVRSVDFNQQGNLALSGSEDHGARLWNVQNGELVKHIKHEDQVQLVRLSDDGKLALSVSKYDKALLWSTDNDDYQVELPLKTEHIRRGLHFSAARFNHNNNLLLTGRPDQVVQLWQLEPLMELKRWKLPKRKAWKPTSAAVIDLAFQDEHNFIAAASNGIIYQLNINDPSASLMPNLNAL
ncbi:WD40 repeat domain-containing protein [Agaribacterium sp. ZY112]|uniref:WD40 repeat domain-containing protein n=1 Tax=Agaribacterium sp. ZY112 TaxID=3233574 RepID=UPI003524B7A3